LVVYLFMNLGAFAVVAFLRNQTGSEDLSSFRGLVRRSPILVVTLAIFLLSLLGMPPLAGFAAKLQIFSALLDGGNYYVSVQEKGIGVTLYALLAVGAINTVLSAWYYIKVLKVMCVDVSLEEVEGRPSPPSTVPAASAAFASILALTLFVLLVRWNSVMLAGNEGVSRFLAHPVVAAPPQPQEARR
jgi:NADH-quinone oxidoreductase subunit N